MIRDIQVGDSLGQPQAVPQLDAGSWREHEKKGEPPRVDWSIKARGEKGERDSPYSYLLYPLTSEVSSMGRWVGTLLLIILLDYLSNLFLQLESMLSTL